MVANPSFCEVQQFRQPLLWLLILGVACLFWYALITQVGMGIPFGSRPLSNEGVIGFWVAFGILLPLAFFMAKLTIEVREDGVYWQLWPLHLNFRRVLFVELREAVSTRYQPILEYGGWGLRFGLRGRAYNISGNHGVQLILKNGRPILLGSQRPDDLAAAIQQWMSQVSAND